MRTYVRTTKRLAPGVAFVSYQKPGQFLFGIFVVLVGILAILHSVFGSWLPWVISGFVVIMWLGAISGGKAFAKLFWSVALMLDVYSVWISQGCPGNAGFCVQIEADRLASEQTAAVRRAEEHLEDCATRTMAEWRSDPDCRIYTEQEIAQAKAKYDVREAEEAAKRDAESRREEMERTTKLLNDRDAARKAQSFLK